MTVYGEVLRNTNMLEDRQSLLLSFSDMKYNWHIVLQCKFNLPNKYLYLYDSRNRILNNFKYDAVPIIYQKDIIAASWTVI